MEKTLHNSDVSGTRTNVPDVKVVGNGDMFQLLCKDHYDVEDPKLRQFRYGVQVNSLNLTQRQPENNVARIIYEFLSVVLSKNARARSIQLPAWNEAFGLPRKWDQQWSLRLQQIMAFETDLLEYDDIFEGSEVIARKEEELEEEAAAELKSQVHQIGDDDIFKLS